LKKERKGDCGKREVKRGNGKRTLPFFEGPTGGFASLAGPEAVQGWKRRKKTTYAQGARGLPRKKTKEKAGWGKKRLSVVVK